MNVKFRLGKKLITLLSLLLLLSCSAPEGEVESFYDSGQLQIRTTYIDGYKEFKVETYFENGNLKAVADWKNNKMNGDYLDYHENGKLRKKTTMIDNKMTGKIETYRLNGEKESSGTIKDDIWEGEFTYYLEDKAEGFYIATLKQGKKEGWNIKFNADGKEEFRKCFQEDEEVRSELCD